MQMVVMKGVRKIVKKLMQKKSFEKKFRNRLSIKKNIGNKLRLSVLDQTNMFTVK